MIAAIRSRLRPSSVLFALWLLVLWIFVWGSLTLANLVSGIAVVAFVLIAVPRDAPEAEDPIIRPLAVVSLVGWFIWQVVVANVHVAIEVMRPPGRSRIRTAIVAVPLPGSPRGVATSVANALTLTPGTLTVEVDPTVPVLYVHVLQFDDIESVRAVVYDLERRIVAAVGSAEARKAAEGREVTA